MGDMMPAIQRIPETDMADTGEWVDIGAAEEFKRTTLREAKLGERLIAVSFKD